MRRKGETKREKKSHRSDDRNSVDQEVKSVYSTRTML